MLGQRLAGSWGIAYSHAAIEIDPKNGILQIAESEPDGLRIWDMGAFMSDAANRGSNVDRYSSNTAITSAQTGALSSIAQDHVEDSYNFMIFFTNRSDDKFTCADFCDYAARMANMPPINDKPLYGLSPLPSDLSKSANYHMSVMDWPGK